MLTDLILAALPAPGATYATSANRDAAARSVATEVYRRIVAGEADEWLAAVTRVRDDARLRDVSERAKAHWAALAADAEPAPMQYTLMEA